MAPGGRPAEPVAVGSGRVRRHVRQAQAVQAVEELSFIHRRTRGWARDDYADVTEADSCDPASYYTDLLEAVELGFLLDIAEVVVYSARNRKESRGGHQRDDYPKRDDENYLVHTMAYLTGDPESAEPGEHIRLDWKPVVITNYQPMERKY